MQKKEKSAKGVHGFLLLNPFTGKHFFRIYSENKKNFTDYDLASEDIEIEILSNDISLYSNGKLDWSSWVLQKGLIRAKLEAPQVLKANPLESQQEIL